MKYLFFSILLLPIVSFAQSSSELVVGEQSVSYDGTTTTDTGTLYYQENTLVASEHQGVTLLYQDEQVTLEAHDTDGDGALDVFLTLGAEGEVVDTSGEGASMFERPETVEFAEFLASEGGGGFAAAPTAEEDLVGSLDSITIPSGAGSWLVPVFILAAIVAGWWYFRGRKKFDEDE
jgi:hypothetical protein